MPANVRDGMKRRLAERYSVTWNDLRVDTPIEITRDGNAASPAPSP